MNKFELLSEIALRCALFFYHMVTAFLNPRHREIHEEEWWLYMNPPSESYVPSTLLIIIILLSMLLFPVTAMLTNKKRYTNVVINALLGFSLSNLLNLCITNTLKLLVGRPRPDFFYRCYPEGRKMSITCSGDESVIKEGLKSFPSGHSSLSMASFGFISLFLISQFKLFGKPKSNKEIEINGNGYLMLNEGSFSGCKFVISILPLFGGIMVCVSRLLDFHHHYEDILAGGIIGFLIAFFSYRLYFLSIFHKYCDIPRYDLEFINMKRFSKEGNFFV